MTPRKNRQTVAFKVSALAGFEQTYAVLERSARKKDKWRQVDATIIKPGLVYEVVDLRPSRRYPFYRVRLSPALNGEALGV